jgi:hypothetical protein
MRLHLRAAAEGRDAMTLPDDETIERESDKLFVTDAELIRRLGVPEKPARQLLRLLDEKPTGFPRKQKLFGNRRYWPAVKAFLDKSSDLESRLGAARVAPERPPRSGLPRRSPAAVIPMRRGSNE